MLFNTLQKIELFKILFYIDTDLAERFRQKACPYCSGTLHSANYDRKPRGGPGNIPDQWLVRHSFCCSRESCRRRALPPSCRFWDRKVYWGAVILVALTLKQGRYEGYSINKLSKIFGVARYTIKRWITCFKEDFPSSDRWKRIKGQINIYISHNDLPGTLIHFFIQELKNTEFGLINSIKFLSGVFEML